MVDMDWFYNDDIIMKWLSSNIVGSITIKIGNIYCVLFAEMISMISWNAISGVCPNNCTPKTADY